MSIRIQLGQEMSPQEAKGIVDELYQKVAQRWEDRVNHTPFMLRLREGKLPLKVLQTFFRNWGGFTIEINTLVACSYHKFLTFFKKHRDLMAPLGEKIADEFIHPKPPGHFLVMLQTAQAFGLTEEEIFTQPMLSEFRAKIDFMRSLLYEGTTAEWYGGVTTEEQIGHWSAVCYKALTEHYGLTREQTIYFSTHVEADLEEHEEGVMGHGSFNRLALQRLLESGMADERPTYGVEYCAMTSVDLHGVMLRSALEEAERS
ncbi:MAG: iron-containing redox enzyme family protein [Deltaproteobacteria bacterium]|nr:iron-containing redox enzyme family protein [Deltaproteobacteria bacterium]